MIKSKSDYLRYLAEDRKALGKGNRSTKNIIKELFFPDYIYNFQRLLRKAEYFKNVKKGPANKIFYFFIRIKLQKLSLKLGFSIPENVFGPGLAIVHYGTIVVNANAKIGANCRIHACTNIGASGGSNKAPRIGDNVYLAPGVKIFGNISIPNNTAIGANAAVNKTFTQENTLIAGVPARQIKTIEITSIIKHIK